MSKTIVKSVRGLLFIDDKIVLIKRRDIPIWEIPGGAIDPEETPEEAIVREIKEETGINAKVEKKVALYSSDSKFLTPVFLFKLSPISCEELKSCKNEVKEINSFKIEALPSPLAPFYKSWIEDTSLNIPYFEKFVEGITTFNMTKYFLCHPIISIRFLLMKMGIHLNF